jgi:hypothetical protein
MSETGRKTDPAAAAPVVPVDVLIQILTRGINDNLSALAGRTATIEIVEPDNIVGQVFDNRVRVLSEDGHPWFEAIVSLKAAEALAALVGLTEGQIAGAKGPIPVKATITDEGSAVQRALARLDGPDGSLYPGFAF